MSDITKRVEELMKLPQSLCNGCGKCCYAIFRGGMLYEEVLALATRLPVNEEEAKMTEGAKDFLTVFEPYETTEVMKKYNEEFVTKTLEHFGKKENEVTYFKCRYLDSQNHCTIHEDRPNFCRMYPIPSPRTYFNPGCGYKEQAEKNWAEIQSIIDRLNDLENKGRLSDEGAGNGNH
ncbi:MAG: YkgJ family cysteine cluster protein [Candidatus Gastranaerophilales bacterium]|jgi:Fe-S-cluster containining protein|nr:YkgJ family cysteine cluster protein [Candidatus Gastranaerophilales bacterium]